MSTGSGRLLTAARRGEMGIVTVADRTIETLSRVIALTTSGKVGVNFATLNLTTDFRKEQQNG